MRLAISLIILALTVSPLAAETVINGSRNIRGHLTTDGKIDIGTVETFADLDATPDVSTGIYWNTFTNALTITDFDGSPPDGQLLYVNSQAAITFDCTSSGLDCGSTDIVTAAGDSTIWLYDGTNWDLLAFKDQSTDMGSGGGGGHGDGANCAAGEIALGVDGSGAVQGCYEPAVPDLASSTSAELLAVLSDETGTGVAVFGTNPTLTGLIMAGDITRAGADFDIDLTGAGTRTLDVENSTASQQTNLRVDGTISMRNGAVNLGTWTTSLTGNRTWTMQDGTGTVAFSADIHGNGSNCAAGSYPLGVDALGAIESCTDASTEIDSILATHTAISTAHHTATVEINDLEADDPPNVADDEVYVGTGAGAGAWVAIPDCGAAGDTLNYTAGTNTWSCGSDAGAAEVNDLETTDPPNVQNDEVYIGTGAGAGAWASVTNCDDTTGKTDFDGTSFTCATDQTAPATAVRYGSWTPFNGFDESRHAYGSGGTAASDEYICTRMVITEGSDLFADNVSFYVHTADASAGLDFCWYDSGGTEVNSGSNHAENCTTSGTGIVTCAMAASYTFTTGVYFMCAKADTGATLALRRVTTMTTLPPKATASQEVVASTDCATSLTLPLANSVGAEPIYGFTIGDY